MNKRAQAYSDNYSAKGGSQAAPLNEAEIRARLDQFAKELAQAQRDRASH